MLANMVLPVTKFHLSTCFTLLYDLCMAPELAYVCVCVCLQTTLKVPCSIGQPMAKLMESSTVMPMGMTQKLPRLPHLLLSKWCRG